MTNSAIEPTSIRGLRWAHQPVNTPLSKQLARTLDINPTAAAIVSQRLDDKATAQAFLQPQSYADFMAKTFPEFSKLKDFDTAAARLADAVMNKEMIGISGDYDCDGNSSVALMCRFLMGNGVPPSRIHVHIPNREIEGYGVNDAAVQAMLDKQIEVLFTLDNGTSAYGAIEKAAAGGLPVVVVDHHGNHAAKGLPNAIVVNPNRHDETSKLAGIKDIAAVGVTFLVCARAVQLLEERGFYTEHPQIKKPDAQSWLGLVALATIGDVVNLASPVNRMFVKEGIASVNAKQDPYLSALVESAQQRFPISEETAAFTLAPIVNAPGRLGDSVGWAFLSGFAGQDKAGQKDRLRGVFTKLHEIDRDMARLSDEYVPRFNEAVPSADADYSAEELSKIAEKEEQIRELEARFGAPQGQREERLLMLLSKECNEERKALEGELSKRARLQAQELTHSNPERHTLVAAGEGWHPGLIGIVAGRLKEEYNMPVVVGSINSSTGNFKCSARSIKVPGSMVDIGHAFRELQEEGVFDKAGGHPMAAGASFHFNSPEELNTRLEKLRTRLEDKLGVAAKQAKEAYRVPVSGVLDLKQIQSQYGEKSTERVMQFVQDSDAVRPYGEGNPRPKVVVPNVYASNIRRSKDGKHLFFTIQQPGGDISIPATAFHVGGTPLEDAVYAAKDKVASLLGTLSVELKSVRGSLRPALQLRMEDLFVHDKEPRQGAPVPCIDKLSPGMDAAGMFAVEHSQQRG